MSIPTITYCPGTLAEGNTTYSKTALNRMFEGRKVGHILPYKSPATNAATDELFQENQKRISISGVQEKFSVVLEKNKLRLINEGEQGTYILKPIPSVGSRTEHMPANEHLTMQIARQVFGIETAENALIFFSDGKLAYITKRFDINPDGGKWATEDFASLMGKTPQTHGEHYKYTGNYLDLFLTMKKYIPAYLPEALKLFRILVFNYLFSNGDAHLKNFSVRETPFGDFTLSPFYDLMNSRLHVQDTDFALEEGLLPPAQASGKVSAQFKALAENAGITTSQAERILAEILADKPKVETLINASFLDESRKRSYLQSYQFRKKRLLKE